MPTFQSIPLHPVLRQRLLQPPEQEPATTNNVGNATPSCASSMAIGTPQALLSRSPHQILQLLQPQNSEEIVQTAGIAHVDSLRHQVAQAMMTKTHTGKHNQRINKALSQQEEATNYTQPSFLAGYGAACSVLELCRYQQQQQSTVSLTTGCQALDQLLSFPKELKLDVGELSHDSSSLSNFTGHSLIPMGHVLQVSGHAGTGKTQLVLQLALQMAQQGCQVHYLVSSAGHSIPLLASRLAQLAAGCSDSSTVESILSQISVQSIRSTQELVVALSRIQQRLEDENTESPQLIIVDSYSAMLVDADSNMTTRIETWMKQLAHLYNITVCATMNHTTTNNNHFDIHVGLEASSTSTSSIRATLLEHPAKLLIFENLPTLELFLTPLGMTSP
jgi:archaellum biogenesis ATPase FlaH